VHVTIIVNVKFLQVATNASYIVRPRQMRIYVMGSMSAGKPQTLSHQYNISVVVGFKNQESCF